MACSVPYIRGAYDGHPELIDKLEQINADIWREIYASNLFREYGKTRLFSKPDTQQYQKQLEFIRSINNKYHAPQSLIKAVRTKSTYNFKVVVNVRPIAEQVWLTTDAANRLKYNESTLGIDYSGESDPQLLADQQETADTQDLPNAASKRENGSNIREKYFPETDAVSAEEVLEKIANSDHNLAPLARKLLKFDVDIPITLIPEKSIASIKIGSYKGTGGGAVGVYYSGENRIEIAEFGNFKGTAEATIIHEILHHLTIKKLRAQGSASVEEFKRIFQHVKQFEQDFDDTYPLANIDEFIVGIFTNAKFIRQLRGMASISGIKTKSVWDDIIDYFRKLFGLLPSQTSLLEQAMAVASDIIEHPQNTEELYNNLSPDLADVEQSENNDAFEGFVSNIISTSKDITKGKGKIKNRETGEFEETDRYFYKGKQVDRRVSDITKDLYEKRTRGRNQERTEDQRKFDEFKASQGTAGHEDFQHARSLMVGEDNKLLTEDQYRENVKSDNYTPKLSPGDKSVYESLRENLWKRLSQFPEGSVILSEIPIVNTTAKSSIGGTVDLMVISPDKEKGFSVNMLDWKFIGLDTSRFDDIPWYDIESWRTQMEQYKKILQYQYGVKENQFLQTRMVPIITEYNKFYNINTKRWTYSVDEVTIGDSDIKKIKEDYLIPVGVLNEKTGNERIDRLVSILNNMYTSIFSKEVNKEEKRPKADQLNALFKAIRHLQMKQSIDPLIKFADALNTEMQKMISLYEEKYKNINIEDAKNLKDDEISKFLDDLGDIENNLQVFSDLHAFLEKIYKEKSSTENKTVDEILEDSETIRRIDEVVKDSSINRDLIHSIQEEFIDNVVGKREGRTDLLTPEVTIRGLSRLFSSSTLLQSSMIQTLTKIVRRVKDKSDFETDDEIEKLRVLEENYNKLASSKGLNKNNKFSLIKKKNANKLIDVYSKTFYETLTKKIASGDVAWLRDNLDMTLFREEIAKRRKEELEHAEQSLYFEVQTEDGKKVPIEGPQRQRKIDSINDYYNIASTSAGVWKNRSLLSRFPLLSKWQSEEYKELNKPENKAALDFYNYIRERNEYFQSIGYISKREARSFLPYVRSSLVERLITNKKLSIGRAIMDSISIDEATVGYGDYDALTGEAQNKIPRYYTSSIPENEVSDDLFRTMALLNHAAIRYKYLSDIEGTALALYRIERSKKAIQTSSLGKIARDSHGNPQYVSNEQNANLYKSMLDAVVYGQKYVQNSTFDVVLSSPGKLFKAINGKLGRKVLPEPKEGQSVTFMRAVDGLTNFFYLKHLNLLNVVSPISNIVGGSLQTYINAGEFFTPKDFVKAWAPVLSGNLSSVFGSGKKTVAILDYFLPYSESNFRNKASQLSYSKINDEKISDTLFSLMRGSDQKVQAATLFALLQNTIVHNGTLVNVNKYITSQDWYKKRYNNPSKVVEIEKKAKSEIAKLKEEKGVLKLMEIKGDKLVIPGIERNSEGVHAVRRLTQSISKDALGNMTEEETRLMNLSVITKSMMVFKNWIPRLLDVRFGGLKYNSGVEAYEWGRVLTFVKFASTNWLQACRGLINFSLANEQGIDAMRKLYENQSAAYLEKTGKTLQMSEDEFLDLIRKNMRSNARDLLAYTILMAMFFGAKAFADGDDDDDDPRVKSAHNFLVRTLDKLSDEVSFYYNPLSFQDVVNGKMFPVAQTMVDATSTVKHLLGDLYGITFKGDEATDTFINPKYLMRSLPFTKQMTDYLPLFFPEAAKELGVRINTQSHVQ